MNKEHFLTELKIQLRPLYNAQLVSVLETFEQKFAEGELAGKTEQEISKELGSPVKIAQEILKDLNIQPAAESHTYHDWEEVIPDNYNQDNSFDYYHDYDQRYAAPPKKTSLFLRFCQVAGVICFNLFFMIWMLFAAAMFFVGLWIADIVLLLTPILGIISFFVPFTSYRFLTLSGTIVLFGLGLLGFVILKALTVYFLRFSRFYLQSNLRILRGR
ncbi:DUF1700 domain-containing protein [Vagococcus elongatus]|uniref:DUF1700 domain-containing protein n=1 Tax=Vagococcus elongatus TaxID=180344 RepID=A0A430AYD6_9ENTE|nr:DUF1700 domain-containing protein [Vagococcus elongatus]RSU13082.1 hypothetical protein CBF29_05280 [Vagococcus elongatus]